MVIIIILLVVIIISIAIFYFYKSYQNKRKIEAERKRLEDERIKKEKQEAEERIKQKEIRIKQNYNTLHDKLESIKNANIEFREFTNIEYGYFANFKLQDWRARYRVIYDLVKNIKDDESGLEGESHNEFYFFKTRFLKGESYRKHFNEDFVRRVLNLENGDLLQAPDNY